MNKTVAKPEDNLLGKVKCDLVDEGVSPYLRRPLRTLAGVLASRKAAKDTAATVGQDPFPAEIRSSPPGSERVRTVTDYTKRP